MFWPLAMEDLMMLKKASTEAETSALSMPVLSAIWLITSALVTVIRFKDIKNSGRQI